MNSEPAFPCEWSKVKNTPGMTLRDYFAAKAMQAMFADYSVYCASVLAKDSYKIADAMIKARETE
jgi:hypothetical protein